MPQLSSLLAIGLVLSDINLVTGLGSPIQSQPSVVLDSGTVVGTSSYVPDGPLPVNKYLGIPFAQPPLRFARPTVPEPWVQPLNAKTFKPACIQQFASKNNELVFNNPGGPSPAESEDCLYLNVFTPAIPAPLGGRPVLFWIYGGNFVFGTGSLLQYDGTSFASNQDIVVVTFNYRTNVFGFPNTPEIPIEQQNLGLFDQRLALSWVQKNIARFGGDPNRVTIFGQSAGAKSVKMLLAMPLTPLSFHAAIMQSDAQTQGDATGNSSIWDTLVEKLNCSSSSSHLKCVQGLPASTIRSVLDSTGLLFYPAVDNKTYMADVSASIASKQFARVPILLGTNANEGRAFGFGLGFDPFPSGVSLEAAVHALLPTLIPILPKLPSQYPPSLVNNSYEFISQIITDLEFLCHTSVLSNTLNTQGYNIWRYFYNTTFANSAPPQFIDAGVYHSAEIPQVFGTYSAGDVWAPSTPFQMLFSQFMQTTWANFAKYPALGPGWPRLGSEGGREIGDLGSNGRVITLADVQGVDHICEIYQSAGLIVGL